MAITVSCKMKDDRFMAHSQVECCTLKDVSAHQHSLTVLNLDSNVKMHARAFYFQLFTFSSKPVFLQPAIKRRTCKSQFRSCLRYVPIVFFQDLANEQFFDFFQIVLIKTQLPIFFSRRWCKVEIFWLKNVCCTENDRPFQCVL